MKSMRVKIQGEDYTFVESAKDGFFECVGRNLAIDPDMRTCFVSPWYADHICDAPSVPFEIVERGSQVPVAPKAPEGEGTAHPSTDGYLVSANGRHWLLSDHAGDEYFLDLRTGAARIPVGQANSMAAALLRLT